MPENLAQGVVTGRLMPHLELNGKATPHDYTHPQAGGRDTFRRTPRNPAAHAASLRGQLARAKQDFGELDWFDVASHSLADYGLLLNVESEPGFDLQVQSLEKSGSGIVLLNVRQRYTVSRQRYVEAAVFVPFG